MNLRNQFILSLSLTTYFRKIYSQSWIRLEYRSCIYVIHVTSKRIFNLNNHNLKVVIFSDYIQWFSWETCFIYWLTPTLIRNHLVLMEVTSSRFFSWTRDRHLVNFLSLQNAELEEKIVRKPLNAKHTAVLISFSDLVSFTAKRRLKPIKLVSRLKSMVRAINYN